MKIVNPAGRVHPSDCELAPRLASLQGKVVGILDNQKENADAVLQALADALQERGGAPKFLTFTKNFPAQAAENIDEIAAQCDAVINGVGH